ncbi:helix-turn-helix domain-containing protein [Tenacibaculum amylolyticum]|uniref:helix-turn-helix domain-containing protein n=1 Tax=Tenacibaculum amylolyticum TaxID=104269 RepID=UPI0038960253
MPMQRFKEINDLFKATGFNKETDYPEFFILKFEELSSDTAFSMPPYQKDFYQISIILKTTRETKIEIDIQRNEALQNSLFFVSPDHIYSWRRSENVTGYIIYFKQDYFNFYQGNFKQDFAFFNIADKNSFQLSKTSLQSIASDFEKLYREYHTDNLYRYQIIQSSLLSFLFKVKSLDELSLKDRTSFNQKEMLVFKYENLIHNCFRRDKQVKTYAAQLNVSASYLNEVIKEIKGKPAKELIYEKIIIESKKELKFNVIAVSEVAYNVGFEEPTHFARFFKKHTGLTPKEYRNLHS